MRSASFYSTLITCSMMDQGMFAVFHVIAHFTVVRSVTWPLCGSKAGAQGDQLVLIQSPPYLSYT